MNESVLFTIIAFFLIVRIAHTATLPIWIPSQLYENVEQADKVFLQEIWRNHKFFSEKNVFYQNSVLKEKNARFICPNGTITWNKMEINFNPSIPNSIVYDYYCPKIPIVLSCEDYAVCHSGDISRVGKDYRIILHRYCNCDGIRSCEYAGGSYNRTIYRCFEKEIDPNVACKEQDTYRIYIHATRFQDTFRLNIFEKCQCFGKVMMLSNAKINQVMYDPQDITIYGCQLNTTQEGAKLPYCAKDQVCRFYDLTEKGQERHNVLVRDNFTNTCKCSFPRTCLNPEELSPHLRESHCILTNFRTNEYGEVVGTQERLKLCETEEMYKAVIYKHASHRSAISRRVVLTPAKDYIHGQIAITKMNTHLMCRCEPTFYDYVEDYKNSTMDWKTRLSIKSHFCPQREYIPKELQSCKDLDLCRIEYYTYYGETLGRDIRYLEKNITHCECDKGRHCVSSEKIHPKWADTIEKKHFCVKECKTCDICGIMKLTANKESLYSILCHCPGKCSDQPLIFTGTPFEHKNDTQYFRCRINHKI